jgi:hypothetical protein
VSKRLGKLKTKVSKRLGNKKIFWVSKGLGNKKIFWVSKGLGNKKILSFSKHDSLKYWKLKSNVNSHMSTKYYIAYKSIRVTILIIFRFVMGENACYLQNKYMCRQHEILDCRKLHKQLSNLCHRSGKGYVWQLNGILCKVFGHGWVFIFLLIFEVG